ncbi:tripartite tricarboxylate transporter substrate binding protein [Achromobacter xylosoxidans]|uniref:tripartite tricarboxylate transporter substrate binding protein n=1 Tax=Alcaligenes xylosoxydans xylosoxydans TaxID=85698 RepID=UPI001F12B9F3|nr:tripartite tricarboxylate transporter substrate binding protein [Achromobacter xylosoxidans]
MNTRYRTLLWAGTFALMTACTAAEAAYPDKMVKIIVPHPPGGFNDTVSRMVAKELNQKWGQPVVVENRPGASQQIGTAAAAKADPDGYTLLNVSFSHAVNPSLYPKLSYDTARAFAPVAWLGRASNLLAVNPKSQYQSVADVVAAARADPGALTYGSAGPGSSPHLSAELFAQSTEIKLTHVPYKGGAPMATDLMAGQISLLLDNVPNLMPYVKSGKMRALAVTGQSRAKLAPELPTLQEAGIAGYEMTAWYGLVAPAGTPRDVIVKINADIEATLAKPEIRAWFDQQGVEPAGGSPEDFGAFIDAQISKWAEVIKAANITIQ